MTQYLEENKINISTYTTFTLMIFLSIALMFFVKYTVYNLRKEIRVVERQIETNLDKASILEAEWAYLTNPERIRNLVNNIDQFENYSQSKVIQIKDFKLLKPYYTSRQEKYGNNNVALTNSKNEFYY
ncbi:hypothetical protein ACFL0U_03945 [Pseudomonadota bacterium]